MTGAKNAATLKGIVSVSRKSNSATKICRKTTKEPAMTRYVDNVLMLIAVMLGAYVFCVGLGP